MKHFAYLIFCCGLLATLAGCSPAPVGPSKPTPSPHQSEFYLEAGKDEAVRIKLKWDARPNHPNYSILRAPAKSESDDVTSLKFELIGETNEVTFQDLGVLPNSAYFYRVEAHYGDSNVIYSQIEFGRTQALTDDDAFAAYLKLATGTGGKCYEAHGTEAVLGTVLKVLNENAKGTDADIVFLIDNTASMGDDIRAVKAGLNEIISALPASCRLGVATYGDQNDDPKTWYNLLDLTADFTSVRSFINGIKTISGGDGPESVYDGVYETVSRVKWSKPKRMIVVIGDSEPLVGNKTKHSASEVIEKCKQAGVKANLYPILIGTPEYGNG